MKKFALLGAVAALATAGGVFATWTFSDKSVTKPENAPITISYGDIQYADSYGSFAITGAINVKLDGSSEKDNNTVKHDFSGTLTITYTSATPENETVKTTAGWATKEATTVGSTDVKIAHTEFSKELTFTDAENEQTITGDELESLISFTGTINTETELKAFKTAIEALLPVITFSTCTIA